jgi:hypothetical protein
MSGRPRRVADSSTETTRSRGTEDRRRMSGGMTLQQLDRPRRTRSWTGGEMKGAERKYETRFISQLGVGVPVPGKGIRVFLFI